MAKLNILKYPDPRLRTVAKTIVDVTDIHRQQLDDMLETMYDAPGIGLAATQVDIHERMLIIDISEEKDSPEVFINPEIILHNGLEVMEEGCLSVPGIYEKVERAATVTVRALNRDGEVFELEADGMLAVCIQHEIDHLDGKVFVDYLSPLKQKRISKKLEKTYKFDPDHISF